MSVCVGWAEVAVPDLPIGPSFSGPSRPITFAHALGVAVVRLVGALAVQWLAIGPVGRCVAQSVLLLVGGSLRGGAPAQR